MRAGTLLALLLGGCTGFEPVHGDDGGDDGGGASSPFVVAQDFSDAGALNAIWGSSATDVHAVGDDGMIFDYDGKSWTSVVGTTGASLAGIWGTGPNDVYAVGVLAANARGIILHNDGTGWVEQTELPTGLEAIWGIDDTIWAVGIGGNIYKKTSTRDWYKLLTLDPNPYIPASDGAPVLYSIWGNSDTSVLVAGDVDTTFNFIGNSMWVPLYDPVDRTRAYRSVWGPPGPDPNLFVGANYYGVWWFNGKDVGMLQINEEMDRPERAAQFFYGVWGTTSDRVVFVGTAGRIMTFDGGPNGLALRVSPTARDLYAVWGSALDDVWIVGAGALILHGRLTF